MEDVDGFLELGNVHHAISTACLPDPNLPRTRTYLVEWLPVGWLKSGLDLTQLEARFLPSLFWKGQQIVVSRPYPADLFFVVHSAAMYKILYALDGASQVLGLSDDQRERCCQKRTASWKVHLLGGQAGHWLPVVAPVSG